MDQMVKQNFISSSIHWLVSSSSLSSSSSSLTNPFPSCKKHSVGYFLHFHHSNGKSLQLHNAHIVIIIVVVIIINKTLSILQKVVSWTLLAFSLHNDVKKSFIMKCSHHHCHHHRCHHRQQ